VFIVRLFISSAMPTSSLRILAVEDHQHSRELLCEMLSILGHEVHCVGSAEEAVGPLKKQSIDVLIADINLPGMSGTDLAALAVKQDAKIKIIFASGYGYLVADKVDFHFTLLPKPFDLSQLEHALKDAGKR
jgi:CheY-like chemotaxis protein